MVVIYNHKHALNASLPGAESYYIITTYIFPPRTRLNNLSEDPPPAMPVADAAENEENDPDDSALSPGVPTLVEPCPEEL